MDTAAAEERVTPVALCSVDAPELVLYNAVFTFSDDGSYSEVGLELVGFEWTLVSVPELSDAVLGSRTGRETQLTGDVVGTYQVSLTVINELGLRSEEPCITQVDVVAP